MTVAVAQATPAKMCDSLVFSSASWTVDQSSPLPRPLISITRARRNVVQIKYYLAQNRGFDLLAQVARMTRSHFVVLILVEGVMSHCMSRVATHAHSKAPLCTNVSLRSSHWPELPDPNQYTAIENLDRQLNPH